MIDVRAPNAKRRSSTPAVRMSEVAALRAVPELSSSSMRAGSMPAFAPIDRPSQATIMLAATTRLHTSFIVCAWPGSAPSGVILPPMRASHGRTVSRSAGAPETMIESVPRFAPGTPPVTGASTQPMPRARRPAAIAAMLSRPIVDISTYWRIDLPPSTPPRLSATRSLTARVGSEANTTVAASATARGLRAAIAPAFTSGVIASGRGSKTCRRTPGTSRRSAITLPICPSPRKPRSMSCSLLIPALPPTAR